MMTANNHESVGRVARYAQHVRDLAHAFNIHIVASKEIAPDDAGAGLAPSPQALFTAFLTKSRLRYDDAQPFIMIAPIIDETTYAVALHELGHCLHPTGRVRHEHGSKTMLEEGQFGTLRDVRLLLLEEDSAWEWAHHMALEWTPAMSSVETYSRDAYTRLARRFGVRR